MDKNYKLDITYDGTNYHGWQEQKSNELTIQNVMQKAVYAATQKKVILTASGRTDAGVHALCQVASMQLDTSIPADKLHYAINAYLPEDIRVLKAEIVKDDFNARFSSKIKTYIYNIYNSRILNPFYNKYALQVGAELDIELMQKNAALLIGEHDFTSFYKTVQGIEKNPVRTIYNSKFIKNHDLITYEITGNGFLYNMVRIIVGTLVKIGIGQEEKDIISIMNLKNRIYAGPTAKPHGLFLKNVKYD